MNLIALPTCCGAGYLHNLYLSKSDTSLKELKKYIIEGKRRGLYLYHPSYENGSHAYPSTSFGAIFTITSNIFGGNVTDEILSKLGFKMISEFNNPIHNSILKMWMLDLNKVTEESINAITL